MPDLRIATRRSRLALAQARWVARRLEQQSPGVRTSLVEITTSGDLDRSSPMATLTQVGAFVRAVQQAVLDGRADVAVHSGKDLPLEGPPGLVAFYPERESPWDVLCGTALDALAAGARVGTGSPRRAAQLARLRPDVHVDDIRGNVDTRLDKVAAGEYGAVVLAEAGLRRIDRSDAITHRFSLEEMVPAPAQAALAVEALPGTAAAELAATIDDAATRSAVEAERLVLALTGAGCRAALGAYGQVVAGGVRITGFVEDDDGPRTATVHAAGAETAATSLAAALGI